MSLVKEVLHRDEQRRGDYLIEVKGLPEGFVVREDEDLAYLFHDDCDALIATVYARNESAYDVLTQAAVNHVCTATISVQ